MGSDALGPSSWPAVEPWTPAHQAVEISEYETLSMLLDAGADPNEVFFELTLLTHAIDSEGDSHLQSGHPLHTASTAIVLAYGADPRLPSPAGKLRCSAPRTTNTSRPRGSSSASSHRRKLQGVGVEVVAGLPARWSRGRPRTGPWR